MLATHLAADLRRLIGGERVADDLDARRAAGSDFVGLRGVPAVAARPDRPDQVTALLGYAAERGVAVVPRAAGTNLCGGFAPTAESVVLDLSGLNRMVEVDAEARPRRRHNP